MSVRAWVGMWARVWVGERARARVCERACGWASVHNKMAERHFAHEFS